mmetsp:Transcript_22726/g.76806  ORF Transcript_22726/g.76806 Transcript_22726/m.76806 type:complete len:212 (+) Transcript_22726:1330-1965(+)
MWVIPQPKARWPHGRKRAVEVLHKPRDQRRPVLFPVGESCKHGAFFSTFCVHVPRVGLAFTRRSPKHAQLLFARLQPRRALFRFLGGRRGLVGRVLRRRLVGGFRLGQRRGLGNVVGQAARRPRRPLVLLVRYRPRQAQELQQRHDDADQSAQAQCGRRHAEGLGSRPGKHTFATLFQHPRRTAPATASMRLLRRRVASRSGGAGDGVAGL